jgi:fumarate reductase iron-sulfur subunit
MTMTETLQVSLWRGGSDGRYVAYDVPMRANQTVLDVVTWVQRHLDPTLAYRFACRVGMCGSCAMTVNGRPRWTCRTHVSKVAAKGSITIGPLQNLPVIKDLATDMQPFFEKWQAAKGVFAPSRTRNDEVAPIKPGNAARQAADAGIECINCAVCYAACDTVRWNADYLGPAALNRAWTLVNDERDAGGAARLTAVAANGGCHACHSHQSCQEHCPVALNPTASIAGLKRRTMQAYLKGEIKP